MSGALAEDRTALIKRADRALYRAKRDRLGVCLAAHDEPRPAPTEFITASIRQGHANRPSSLDEGLSRVCVFGVI
jgi:hypothetical protein